MESFYTYTAYFLAAFAGGEVLLFPIILAVKLNSSNIFTAMIVAFGGTLSRDWLLFLLFREKGRQLLLKIPGLAQKVGQLEQIMTKNNIFLFLIYRFLFGVVIFIVILFGISGMPVGKFARISLISNILLIVFVGVFGYYFTEFMIEKMNWVNRHSVYYLLGLAFLLTIYMLAKKTGAYLINRL